MKVDPFWPIISNAIIKAGAIATRHAGVFPGTQTTDPGEEALALARRTHAEIMALADPAALRRQHFAEAGYAVMEEGAGGSIAAMAQAWIDATTNTSGTPPQNTPKTNPSNSTETPSNRSTDVPERQKPNP